MPEVIVADLSGQRMEKHNAVSSLFIVSTVGTPNRDDTREVFGFFFMKALFIFLALQQSGAKNKLYFH